jgi:hypothetical protein
VSVGVTQKIRSVVVGVNGEATSEAALRWAAGEALALDVPLTICRTYRSSAFAREVGPNPPLERLRRVDPLLDGWLTESAGIRADVVVRIGRTRAEVAEFAGYRDVAVVPARDSRWLAPLAARRAGWPNSLRSAVTVVVRASRSAVGPQAGHVVIAVGDPAAAGPAIDFGFAYAARHDRPVFVFHAGAGPTDEVWVDDRLLETHLVAPPLDLDRLAAAIEQAHLAHPGVLVRHGISRLGPAGALITASLGAALLVVGSHKSRAGALFTGSMDRLAQARAGCSVAVVK